MDESANTDGHPLRFPILLPHNAQTATTYVWRFLRAGAAAHFCTPYVGFANESACFTDVLNT